MGFVTGYEKLEVAFYRLEQTETATLGDVFIPNEEMPDLTVPIGVKVEKSTSVNLPGELAVAVMCRAVRPYPEMCDGIVPMEYFSDRVNTLVDMVTKQTIVWSEEAGDHHSRLFTGLSRAIAEHADEEWTTYLEELAAWNELDKNLRTGTNKPFEPGTLMHTMVSELPITVEPTDSPERPSVGSEPEDLQHHFGVLKQVAAELPEALGHLASSSVYGFRGVPKRQTPNQFESHVDWLLS